MYLLCCLQTAEKMGITTGSGFDMFVGTDPLLSGRAQSSEAVTQHEQVRAVYAVWMIRCPPLQAKPPTSSSCSLAWRTMSPTSCGTRCCRRCERASCAAHAVHVSKYVDGNM